jgi:hypothetical protein
MGLRDAGPVVDANSVSASLELLSHTSVLVIWPDRECCGKSTMLD